MTGISNTYSSVLRNVGNIIKLILSLMTTQLKTIAGVKTLKHLSPPRKRHRNIGNGGWGLKKRRWRRYIEYHLFFRPERGAGCREEFLTLFGVPPDGWKREAFATNP